MSPPSSDRPRLPCRRLIFDLDGTLVDSAPDLTRALNHILTGLGRPPLPPRTVRHLVGRGARVLIARGLDETGGRDGAPDVEALLPDFLAFYGAHIADESRPFPGAEAVLDWADAQGMALGVCTNKPQALSEALLEALGLRHRFGSIVGGDALAVKKPDPGHLEAVMAALGQGPAVLIGDTETDLLAARGAGIPIALVRFGFSPVAVDTLGADLLLDRFEDLPQLLKPA